MANPSLDDVLKEIERDSLNDASSVGLSIQDEPHSAGMREIAVHEEKQISASPSVMPEDFRSDSIPQITRQFLGGGAVMNQQNSTRSSSGLTPRQKALPKLSYRMLGSLAAMFILVIGLGSAVMLSQTPQDIRQYAYDPNARVDESLEPYLNKQTDTTEAQMPEDEGTQIDAPTEMPGEQASDTIAPLGPPSTPIWKNPIVVAGAAVIMSGVLILFVFLHWLFAV